MATVTSGMVRSPSGPVVETVRSRGLTAVNLAPRTTSTP